LMEIDRIDSESRIFIPKKNPDLMVNTYTISGFSKPMLTQEQNILEKIQRFLSPEEQKTKSS